MGISGIDSSAVVSGGIYPGSRTTKGSSEKAQKFEETKEIMRGNISGQEEETKDRKTAVRGTMVQPWAKEAAEAIAKKATEKKAPYSELAEDGVIVYNGVTFVCDDENERICLGDTSDPGKCISIPLSKGGSLLVNRDNIGDLSKAINMFSPEDIDRILSAIAQDTKAQQMEQEVDDAQDLIREKIDEINARIKSGELQDTFQIGGKSFTVDEWKQFLEKYDRVEEEIRKAIQEEIEKNKADDETKELEQAKERAVGSIVAESTRFTDSDGEDEKTWYITCYTKDEMWCQKCVEGGKTEEMWRMPLSDGQYEQVMAYLNELPKDADMMFVAQKEFWTDFLAGETRPEAV